MKIQFKNLIRQTGMLLVIATVFVACGNPEKNKDQEEVDSTSEKESVQVETPVVADVSFTGQDGQTTAVSALKGKVVFINFWATWCPPCIKELPSINKLRHGFKDNDNVVFLMVDVDGKMEESSAFMKNNNYDLPVFIPAGNIPPDYLGDAIPTTVILDKKGSIAARLEGGRDYTDPEIVKALNELVASE